MSQNRKNKNTDNGLTSDWNKLITNINKSSSNIQQAAKGTATPGHEWAQITNINRSSPNIQQAVKGTAAPGYERIQSVRERYKNIRLLFRYQTNDSNEREENQSTNERTQDDASTGLYREYIIS